MAGRSLGTIVASLRVGNGRKQRGSGLIHFFNKYLLSTYYMLDVDGGTRNAVQNDGGENPCPPEPTSSKGDRQQINKNKCI